MIIRVTELDGGSCKVALVTADGERESRTVATIAEAFALRDKVTEDGFPSERVAEVKAKKGKGK
jgi:hypothetical protein